MTAAPLDLHPRVRLPLFVVLGFVTIGAAYYTGTTGDSVPLLAVAGLLVPTTDYEKLEK